LVFGVEYALLRTDYELLEADSDAKYMRSHRVNFGVKYTF